MEEKYIVKEFGKTVDVRLKNKDSNPYIKGRAKIEILDMNGVCEREVISDNLVKDCFKIDNEMILNALARKQVAGETINIINRTNFYAYSTPSYIYLLDGRKYDDLEINKIDLRINPEDTPTIAFSKEGTAQVTTEKRGTWIDTVVSYPGPNRKRIEMIHDFPLITGNGDDGLGGTFDTIVLVCGSQREENLDIRKDLLAPLCLSKEKYSHSIEFADVYYEHYYGYHDGMLYRISYPSSSTFSLRLYDYMKRGHDILTDIDMVDEGSQHIFHILKDGSIGMHYKFDGKPVFKRFGMDGTFIEEVRPDYPITNSTFINWDIDSNIIYYAHCPSDGSESNMAIFNSLDGSIIDSAESTGVVTWIPYRASWGEMLDMGDKTFITVGGGSCCSTKISNGYETRGLQYRIDFNTFSLTSIRVTGSTYTAGQLYSGNNWDRILCIANDNHSTSSYTNMKDMPVRGKICSKTGLISTIMKTHGRNYNYENSNYSRLSYIPDNIAVGSNRMLAVNKFPPITKTDQRTVRVTYALEYDLSGLTLGDKGLEKPEIPIKF